MIGECVTIEWVNGDPMTWATVTGIFGDWLQLMVHRESDPKAQTIYVRWDSIKRIRKDWWAE